MEAIAGMPTFISCPACLLFCIHVFSAPSHMYLCFAGGEKRRSVGAIDGKDGSPPSSVSHFKPFSTLPLSSGILLGSKLEN